MGIFDFMKKGKAETEPGGMDLPPLPKMEGPAGDTSLPPLPTEMPGEVPPSPMEEKLEPPTAPSMMDMPSAENLAPGELAPLPEVPIPEEEPMTEIPEPMEPPKEEEPDEFEVDISEPIPKMPAEPEEALPEMPLHDDIIPEKIPPLEGIPDVEFKTGPEKIEPMRHKPLPPIRYEMERPPAPAQVRIPEQPEAPVRHRARGPLFVRTDKFRAAVDDIEQIRAKFKEEDNIFFAVSEVKSTQDKQFESFKQTVEDIQRKLLFIDRALFESR